MIQIDTREKEKIIKVFKRLKIPFEQTKLNAGDYFIPEKGICIERKTIQDFCRSYVHGRIQTQIELMQKHYEYAYLFISGSFERCIRFDSEFKKHFPYIKITSYQKMKLHLYINFPQLRILEFPSDKQLALGVQEMSEYSKKYNYTTPHVLPQKIKTSDDVYKKFLLSLPGISYKRSGEIMKEHSTFKKFLRVIKTDDKILKGVNKENRRLIIKALNS